MPSVECRIIDPADAVKVAQEVARAVDSGWGRRAYIVVRKDGTLRQCASKYNVDADRGECILGYLTAAKKPRILTAHGPLLPTMLDEWFDIFATLGWRLVTKEKAGV